LHEQAVALYDKFEESGDSKSLDEAIELHRQALALRTRPHPYRCMSLNNMAVAIFTGFEHQGDSNDLNEAIGLWR
ncbi:hypothetical protein DFH08DRAFT_652614, partial [Mycena albidolilacea]